MKEKHEYLFSLTLPPTNSPGPGTIRSIQDTVSPSSFTYM